MDQDIEFAPLKTKGNGSDEGDLSVHVESQIQ